MTLLAVTVAGCRWLSLRGASDPRGNINFVEMGTDLDFPIRRAFWMPAAITPTTPRSRSARAGSSGRGAATASSRTAPISSPAARRGIRSSDSTPR